MMTHDIVQGCINMISTISELDSHKLYYFVTKFTIFQLLQDIRL